jgi:hypothetical protein
MRPVEILTEAEAQKIGMKPLTMPYKESESWMLENAVRDLGGCNIALVEFATGIEIYRAANELLTNH